MGDSGGRGAPAPAHEESVDSSGSGSQRNQGAAVSISDECDGNENIFEESSAQIKSLKVLQLNAQHKRVSHFLLMKRLEESYDELDVVLIQEPYVTVQGNVPSVPLGWETFFHGIRAKAAILVNKNRCKTFPLSQYYSECIIPVMVNNILFISAYNKQSDLEMSTIAELEKIISLPQTINKRTVIGMDTNGHSVLVGRYSCSDRVAERMEELLITNNMVLYNEPGKNTFRNSRNQTSIIDWTFGKEQGVENIIQNWLVEDECEFLSDHLPIYFNVKENADENNQALNSRKKCWKKANWTLLEESLIEKTTDINWENNFHEDNIDLSVTLLNEVIEECVEISVPESEFKPYRNSWWNEELRTRRREFRKEKNPELKKEKQKQYEREILKAKDESWKAFLQENAGQSDRYLRYKILCKPKSEFAIEPVEKPDGSYTVSREETVQELFNTSFPDLTSDLSAEQTELAEEINNFLAETNNNNAVEEPKITEIEVEDSIRSFQPNKAPGIDGIPAIFFQKNLGTLVPILTSMFNQSLVLGKIPTVQCGK